MPRRDSPIVLNVVAVVLVALAAGFAVWLLNSVNPTTPAGYIGYVTQGAWLGRGIFSTRRWAPLPMVAPGWRTWSM